MRNFALNRSVVLGTGFISLIALLQSSESRAYLENQKTPSCIGDNRAEKQVDNAEILKWKKTSRNQFLGRGYASGRVKGTPSIQGSHTRFIMMLGQNADDGLEVIYNNSFGKIPPVKDGDVVTVCGDYITSTAAAGGYEASPVGAIIHWVHFNPGDRAGSLKHEHGFIAFNSTLVGFDDAPHGAWSGELRGISGSPATRSRGLSGSVASAEAETPSQPASDPSRSGSARPRPGRSTEPRLEDLPEICDHVRGRCQ